LQSDPDILIDANFQANNKVIVNTGSLLLFGKPSTFSETRLAAIANAGSSTITVISASGLVINDIIIITSTESSIT